jgi:hypothetical protein
MDSLSERDALTLRLFNLQSKLEAEGKMQTEVWNKASMYMDRLDTPGGPPEDITDVKAFLDRQKA